MANMAGHAGFCVILHTQLVTKQNGHEKLTWSAIIFTRADACALPTHSGRTGLIFTPMGLYADVVFVINLLTSIPHAQQCTYLLPQRLC